MADFTYRNATQQFGELPRPCVYRQSRRGRSGGVRCGPRRFTVHLATLDCATLKPELEQFAVHAWRNPCSLRCSHAERWSLRPVCLGSKHLWPQGVLVTVTGPFRRVCETRRERNERCPALPIRIRWHPIRSDRGSCRRHGRPPNVPCLFWCRGGVLHL
jgi:hypothetical protein